jgi:hypothetical protein
MNSSNNLPRESRSVRLDEDEWVLAEALAELHRERGAGAGLRRALVLAETAVIVDGATGDSGNARCPQGGHPFVWGNHHPEGTEPQPGEWVVCIGGDGYTCGYNFLWHGHEKLREITERIKAERTAGDR